MLYGYYYWDNTYWLVIIGAVICIIASARVKSTFHRYSSVRATCGLTGAQVAELILKQAGIYDVTITWGHGELTDNYNPRQKTVNLSESVYHSTSVAAISVAAHECGHAIQHHTGYAPVNLRTTLFPVAQISSTIAWPLILIGLLFTRHSGNMLVTAGIICFSMAVLFQLVTLPVEFNASGRAIAVLQRMNILQKDEVLGAKSVLSAAALTYVAAAASTLLQLLRLILLFGGRRRD